MVSRCKHCGAYTNEMLCPECKARYGRYREYKHLQKKDFSFEREHKLEQIRLEYVDLKRAGFKVPKDIGGKL